MTEKVINYTPEQTAAAVQAYMAGQPVEMIAREMGKSVRSIVAKLSREGVYVAKTKAAGTGRVTKLDLIKQIANHVDMDWNTIQTLEKASHEALEALAMATRRG